MAPFLNPQLLLQALQKQQGQGNPLEWGGGFPKDPAAPMFQADPATKPEASSGMLAPSGVAPGGPGTAVGAGASTPKNPAVISDPGSIQQMHTEIMRRMTEPVEVGAPPEAPNFPAAPTMAPLRGGPLGRIVAGLSGFAGQPNPFEIQRRQQFQDALQNWQSQVSPLQATYQDKLRAYAEQMKAKTEAAQAQRYGAMAASYMAPYFGISRTGAQTGGAPKVSNIIKFNQGVPYLVTDPQSGQSYPIDPNDKSLAQIPDHLKPLVVAAQRQHQSWYGEQQRLIQTRGEAFRLNTMYPVMDAEDGMAPVMARGYEILNNPGRYVAGQLGQMALNRENILMDIGDMSKVVRSDFHNLDREFSGEQRALIGSALSAPPGMVAQYVESLARSGLSPAQSKLATDLIQLKENAMAMRGILPGGNTETMRAAIANTLPGMGTPSVPYADIQLDALDRQIARLSRGIPKVPMRAPGGEIPQSGEGAAPPAPVRGPVASQGKLNVQAQSAPKSIRNAADIPGTIPEYIRGADGKLHLKGGPQ